MAKSTNIERMVSEIVRCLSEYSDEAAEVTKRETKKVAKECLKEIKENAPGKSMEYKSGFKYRIMYEGRDEIRIKIYNDSKPSLTHLLEKGHEIVNQTGKRPGRVEGIPHIGPAEEDAREELPKNIKEAIERI